MARRRRRGAWRLINDYCHDYQDDHPDATAVEATAAISEQLSDDFDDAPGWLQLLLTILPLIIGWYFRK